MIPALFLGLLLLASPAWATLYYVAATGGNNGNNCIPDSPGTPMQTIAKGVSCLHPGDTLLIRGGTYNESLRSPFTVVFPSGTSWSTPVTIAGYPGETATITQGMTMQDGFDGTPVHYVIFQNLAVQLNTSDPNNCDIGIGVGGTTHHVRFLSMNVTGCTCFQIAQGTSFMEFIDNDVHGARVVKSPDYPVTVGSYGWYINSNNSLLEGNRVYDNVGYGIHMYLSGSTTAVHDNIIRNNIIYGNCYNDGGRNQGLNAVIMTSGANNLFYNNVVYGNECIGSGAAVTIGGTAAGVYNNTITGNGTTNGGAGLEMGAAAVSPVLGNNLVYGNGSPGITDQGASNPNVFNTFLSNPLFVNAAAHNYALQAGSGAIDAGATVAAVPVDILGVTRPQPGGGAYDIGAYEFASGGGPPAPGPQALRWKFDEGAGSTVADATGNGYTGTLTAGPTWGPGRQGSGMVTMNGTTQYVTTASFVWTAGQPVTVLLWRKVTAGGVTGAFGAHSTVVQDRFGAHLPYSDNVCYWDYGDWHTTGRVSVDCTPYLGRWVRFALVSSGTGGTFKGIYANGTLLASAASSGAPTANLTIFDVGRWVNESGTYYDPGSVDDFRLENRAWSAAEILTEYRQVATVRRHRVSMR